MADDGTSNSQRDRRSFLRRVTAVGGAVACGATGALAAATSAAPSRRAAPAEVRATGPKLLRATGQLSINSPIRVTRSVSAPAAVETPPAPPAMVKRQPSTRRRALNALSAVSGGATLLRQYNVAGGGPEGEPPRGLTVVGVVPLYTLAEAYAAGITLTPTGCEYEGGMYPGHPQPLTYQTTRGWVYPVILQAPDCRIRSERREPHPDNPRATVPVLTIDITTPGSPTEIGAYLLELHAPGYREDRINASLRGGPVEWSRTSDGTLVVAAEMCGTSSGGRDGGPWFHWLWFEQRGDETVDFYFCWLNVIAL